MAYARRNRWLCVFMFCIGLALGWGFAPVARAQSADNADCTQKLLDEALYKQHDKASYEFLIPGKEGWIFRSRTDFREDFEFTLETVAGFQNLSQALKEKGTDLVIVFPPPRGIVAIEKLPASFPAAVKFNGERARENYKSTLSAMKQKNVHFIGLSDVAQPDQFYRKTDQHWTIRGARDMAQIVADYVQNNLESYAEIPKHDFETFEKAPYEFKGQFNDVVELFCGFSLPPETDIEAVTTKKASTSEDALFGDAPLADIVLVGTSNSKAKRFETNFDGALREFLRADVVNEAVPNAGIYEPLLDFLKSARFQTQTPKILIWEIPGYYRMKDSPAAFKEAVSLVRGGTDAE